MQQTMTSTSVWDGLSETERMVRNEFADLNLQDNGYCSPVRQDLIQLKPIQPALPHPAKTHTACFAFLGHSVTSFPIYQRNLRVWHTDNLTKL